MLLQLLGQWMLLHLTNNLIQLLSFKKTTTTMIQFIKEVWYGGVTNFVV